MSNNAICCRNIGKMYRLYRRTADKVLDIFGVTRMFPWRKNHSTEFWALRGLDLTVRHGERVGIIGRNGAGKSTLLKIIAGTVTPTEGAVSIAGRVQALLELGTGFHPEFTGRENIYASLAYLGFSDKQIRQKEDDIIDFAELDTFIDQPIKTYSAGMYARLAFSVATALEPEILIIDEILSAGDAYFAGKCLERMRSLTEERGATVLFVSHDLGSVQQVCQRVIWIDRGRIVMDGEPLSIIKAYAAAVRHDEELRLRARDLKILKKQVSCIDKIDDIYTRLLFHIVPVEGAVFGSAAKIRSITLSIAGEKVAGIEVGSPMDNSPDKINCLIDAAGYMNWGSSQRDARGFYRELGDFGGTYKHAPFELAIPKAKVQAPSAGVTFEVAGESAVPIAVEIYNGKSYVRLGTVQPSPVISGRIETTVTALISHAPDTSSHGEVTSPLPAAVSVQPPHADDISEYGSRKVKIVSVKLMDRLGKEKKVFDADQYMKIEIAFACAVPVETAVIFFVAYTASGSVGTQAWTEPADWNRQAREGVAVFEFSPLCLGAGDYVASVGVFDRLSVGGVRSEPYHVLDRHFHFKIVEAHEALYQRGVCRQPFTQRIEARVQPCETGRQRV